MANNNGISWTEWAEKHPEYFVKKKKKNNNKNSNSKLQYMCQCKCGHVFDYRERVQFEDDKEYYAPCQGRCPNCYSTEFSFIENGTNIYPIKFNFLG